jgi:hypothetical protein
MRWLRRAGLGTEKIACRTAQNLYSLHRSRRPGKLMQTLPSRSNKTASCAMAKQSASVIALELLLLAMALMGGYWAAGALDAFN